MPSVATAGRSVYGKTIIDLTPSQMAAVFEVTPYMDTVCKIVYNVLPESFCAKVISSGNLSPERSAYILSSEYLTDDYACTLFKDAIGYGMSYDKGAKILSYQNLPDSRFYQILNSLSDEDFLSIVLDKNFLKLGKVLNTDNLPDTRIEEVIKQADYYDILQYAKYKIDNFDDVINAWENASWVSWFGNYGDWEGVSNNVSISVFSYSLLKFPKDKVVIDVDRSTVYDSLSKSLLVENNHTEEIYVYITFSVSWSFEVNGSPAQNAIYVLPLYPVDIDTVYFEFYNSASRTTVCFSNNWKGCQIISVSENWNLYVDNLQKYATLSSVDSSGYAFIMPPGSKIYVSYLALYGGFVQ